jgi:hypothetical protein
MKELNELLAQFPLSKDFDERLQKTLFSAEYRTVLIVKLIEILGKTPSSIEEAAMFFNQAKPLASMFTQASMPRKPEKETIK